MNSRHLLLLFFTFLLSGCLPQRGGIIKSAYNDLTAHYNAYWIANEHIKAIEQSLYDKYEWNYNKILPIYARFDSTDTASLQDQIQDCLKKASLAIQHHPDSKWEHPSYILVGKARFYNLEFTDAIEAFKYVNTKSESEDVRHESLANLIRTFTKYEEYKNAQAVIDHLAKEELNTNNRQLYYLNQANYYQQLDNLDLMVQNLVKAEEILTSNKDKARIQFIIGQVYQQLGFDGSAFYYYEKSLKSNPGYELSFYTKLNMAQVTELTEGKDVKTIRKYFKKLLVDRKNFEYNDKIYYEMGLFEEKNGNLQDAIGHFITSTKLSKGNARQKGLSFLSLARIHYDSLKDYELAKQYYDSTVQTLPKDEDNYTAIKERQEILVDFVKHITTVRKNDSLLQLAELSPDSLQALALSLATRDSLATAEKKAAKEKLARTQRQRQNLDQREAELIALGEAGGSWYFDNTNAVSSGYTNFERTWGKIELGDHWRRSNKISNTIIDSEVKEVVSTEKQDQPKEPEKTKSANQVASEMLKGIPRNEDEKSKLNVEIMNALYELGNIYNFRLVEPQNAIDAFQQLLSRYPKSPQEPEVLYQLYLLQKDTRTGLADLAANQLTNQYPESIYAKLIANPNFREESFAATIQLQTAYKRAYDFYLKEDFKQSLFVLDSALSRHSKNEFSDNLVLLKILNIGKLEGQHKYQLELDQFLKNYSDSELISYVEQLASTSTDYKINLYSSSKGLYKNSPEQSHYFVLVYRASDENSDAAIGLVEQYTSGFPDKYRFSNILLSEEYSMVVISDLDGKKESMEVLATFNDQMNPFQVLKGQEHYLFAISEENFGQLYKTKDIENYRSFFDKNYL